MVALTEGRMTKRRDGDIFERPMAATKIVFEGGMVCLTATGFATPGATATTLVADGVATATVNNAAGADGAISVTVRKGTFHFFNSAAGDAITRAEIGDTCFIVDDQTVAKTNGGGTRSQAGRIVDVDAQGVWVDFA